LSSASIRTNATLQIRSERFDQAWLVPRLNQDIARPHQRLAFVEHRPDLPFQHDRVIQRVRLVKEEVPRLRVERFGAADPTSELLEFLTGIEVVRREFGNAQDIAA
jgi:hypothetical protein